MSNLKHWLYVILMLSFSVVVCSFTDVYSSTVDESPNIMIVHSYDLSYLWTSKQDQGIRSVLLDTYPKANIYTEVLDAKRFEKSYIMGDVLDGFIDKYSDRDFDIILTTDDIALEFSLEVRRRMDLDIPIAFSGVGEDVLETYVEDEADVTGVYEIRRFNGMIELMRLLQPEAKKVVILNDTSSSSRQLVQHVLEAFDELEIRDEYDIMFWEDKPYNEVLSDVSQLDDETALFLISYHQSYDGVIKTGQVFCEEISHQSSVPMYSLGELYFGSGLTGGEFLSGDLHGQKLGDIAIRLLSGESAGSIPIHNESTSYLGVDENMLRQFGLEKIDLPEDTVIINQTVTFYQLYTQLVWTIVIIILLLTGFILILLNQRRLVIKANDTLTKQQDDLKYLSYHDSVTGLYNRRYFEKNLLEIDQHLNYPICIVMADVNGLKLINDAFGHTVGDDVLIKTAQAIKKGFPNSTVCRIGGDEFSVTIKHANVQDVDLKLNRVIQEISKINLSGISLSISAGYAFKETHKRKMNEVFSEAEDWMYRRKLTSVSSNRSDIIETIIETVNQKDPNSKLHSKVVSELAYSIAGLVGLSDNEKSEIKTAGLLHDIGKIIVPISILNKVGKLLPDEYEELKRHSEIGYRILNSVPSMRVIADYVLHHHERIDGKGYPSKIKSDDIPVQSKIIAIADAMDAMLSDRTYRSKLSKEACYKELVSNRGTQFSEEIVDVVLKHYDDLMSLHFS